MYNFYAIGNVACFSYEVNNAATVELRWKDDKGRFFQKIYLNA